MSDANTITKPDNGHVNGNGHASSSAPAPALEWDWDVEHADRKREAAADAALAHSNAASASSMPFEVDRRVLKDVVLEHMGSEVARIEFLSAGTFHKAYLITLTNSHQLVARVARRFMPRLKTASEVATLSYLRTHTTIPVPEVHKWDANPWNRLGGEWLLMSKVSVGSYARLSYARLSLCAGRRGGVTRNEERNEKWATTGWTPARGNTLERTHDTLAAARRVDGKEGLDMRRALLLLLQVSLGGVDIVRDVSASLRTLWVERRSRFVEGVFVPFFICTEGHILRDKHGTLFMAVLRMRAALHLYCAPGVPLSQVYHSLSYAQLVRLLDSLARLVVPLFGHRFPQIGSLYLGPDPSSKTRERGLDSAAPTPRLPSSSNAPTPTLTRASTLTMSSLSSAFSSMDTDTPRASQAQEKFSGFPFTPILTPRPPPAASSLSSRLQQHMEKEEGGQREEEEQYHVGPIISWPFFGSFRGDLPSTPPSTSPLRRIRVLAVQRENAGSAAGHRLHLDPAEILSSRHHRVAGLEDLGDESDDSDEWGLEESEDEWEGPGDVMYRDYRRGQRGAFLVAHTQKREEEVRTELGRWMRVVERLEDEWRAEGERTGVGWGVKRKDGHGDREGEEEFALDAHDLSLENVFVDPEDPAVITCIIDWESTTTRPLWAAAHLPAFLQSSPFTAKLFREAVARLADPTAADKTSRRPSDAKSNGTKLKLNGNGNGNSNSNSKPAGSSTAPQKIDVDAANSDVDTQTIARLAKEWLHHEHMGMRLRMAHRVVEWDGWEEGLVESILGPEEVEEEWFHHSDHEDEADSDHDEVCAEVEAVQATRDNDDVDGADRVRNGEGTGLGLGKSLSRRRDSDESEASAGTGAGIKGKLAVPKPKAKGGTTTGKPAGGKLFAKNLEREKEQMLDTTGDICGGRGGELGRRLEAWLTHSENASPEDEEGKGGWRELDAKTHDFNDNNIDNGGYEAEAETD
ncbi:hypothetical protein MVEN_01334500 [Mycena venus]|uniref:Aminoglycoside phosphotransferase domain-containing protein n=1 Tax=Mycena venus TaxID=2733690 RepID=A0A8H7CTY0_9AGAR|nr:hypothetical protein MVEN_01334500 [Mycena venus]